MKVGFALALGVLLVTSNAAIRADAPVIEPGVYIYDGNLPIEVDRHSSPCVVDWNNDGAKDLVVGQFGYGYITLFLNRGSDVNPVFEGGELIESNGTPITTSYG